MTTLREQVAAILAEYPTLNRHGFSTGYERHAAIKPENFDALRSDLLTDLDLIQACVAWLEERPCLHGDSYWLKHVAEGRPDGVSGLDRSTAAAPYMPNGVMVVAAILLGRLGAINGPNAEVLRADGADCPRGSGRQRRAA